MGQETLPLLAENKGKERILTPLRHLEPYWANNDGHSSLLPFSISIPLLGVIIGTYLKHLLCSRSWKQSTPTHYSNGWCQEGESVKRFGL
jgi:hypothetical protein